MFTLWQFLCIVKPWQHVHPHTPILGFFGHAFLRFSSIWGCQRSEEESFPLLRFSLSLSSSSSYCPLPVSSLVFRYALVCVHFEPVLHLRGLTAEFHRERVWESERGRKNLREGMSARSGRRDGERGRRRKEKVVEGKEKRQRRATSAGEQGGRAGCLLVIRQKEQASGWESQAEGELVHISWDRISWLCESRMWGKLTKAGERYPQLLPATLREEQKCYCTDSTVSMCQSMCVCEKNQDRVWIGMRLHLLTGVMQICWMLVFPLHTDTPTLKQSVCFALLGYTGGLAECRANGREVEGPTERPGTIFQRPGLTVRPSDCAYQTTQQVRGVLLL